MSVSTITPTPVLANTVILGVESAFSSAALKARVVKALASGRTPERNTTLLGDLVDELVRDISLDASGTKALDLGRLGYKLSMIIAVAMELDEQVRDMTRSEIALMPSEIPFTDIDRAAMISRLRNEALALTDGDEKTAMLMDLVTVAAFWFNQLTAKIA